MQHVPTCPKCFQNFHRGAESNCPHCGFLLEEVLKRFGRENVRYRRINDAAGALRQADRVRLARYLEKIEKRIAPAALSVYFPNITEPFILRQHSFWYFNQISVQQADFGRRNEEVQPEWLLALVIDIRTASAHFIWGYQLDPYINIDRINASVLKARLLLRDGLLVQGIRKVMKDVTRQIASQVARVAAHPEKYAVKRESAPGNGKGGGS